MKKIIFFLLALCSALSFAETSFKDSFKKLPTEQKQIRLEFALDITEYTNRARTMTKNPLPEYIPASEYMELSREEAFLEYKKIADAESENLLAQTIVGYCYVKGVGTEPNKALGFSYLKKAGDKNFAPALNSLGAFSDSDTDAFAFYEKSAAQNYVSALYNLFFCYSDGKGCEKSLEKAEAILNKIRDLHLDDPDIYLTIAGFHSEYLEEGREQLIPYYVTAAEHGANQAMFELWFDQYTKFHDSEDEENGKNRAKWYRKYLETNRKNYDEIAKRDGEKLPYLENRAAKGELYAVKELINYYADFFGVHANRLKKSEWLKKAADLGDSSSCFSMVELYAKGKYVERDFDKAFDYYKKGIKYAKNENEKSSASYSMTPLKEDAFTALKVNGFVNRYKKSAEKFARTYGGAYSDDFSFVSQKSALAFCEEYADSDEDCALALAYYKYLNESEAAANDYLNQKNLSDAKQFFPFDEYDLNSKEYQAKRAMYLRDEKTEIGELEENIRQNPNDGKSYFELAKKYEYSDSLEGQKKAFEYLKKSVECGYAEACYYLSNFYKSGKIFDSDLKKTGEILKKGADSGDATCIFALAEMYERGSYFDGEKGVFVQDMEKAIELFTQAARDFKHTSAKFSLENYNIKLEDDSDEMYWLYHSKPRKNAKPFDWDSWTFGDFEFEDLPEDLESEKIPEYVEDEGYWENTEKVECSFEKDETNYFRTKIDGLKKGKNYRLVFYEELDSEKLSELYDYFSESEHASSLVLDLDLRRCPVPEGYLKDHSLCGSFRNIYMPDCLVYIFDKCFDVYADKIVFGSKLKNFRDPFASGKYGLLDFTLIPDEEFTGRLAYRISQLKVNYMRQVPIKANFEILTIEDRHSLKIMKEVRETLESNPDKRYIVDFSHSVYAIDPETGDDIPYPKNFMACQQNLYYLVLGGVDYVDFPENMCRDCKNLRCIVMWDYGDAGEGAFKGVNKNCTFVDGRLGAESPLSEM